MKKYWQLFFAVITALMLVWPACPAAAAAKEGYTEIVGEVCYYAYNPEPPFNKLVPAGSYQVYLLPQEQGGKPELLLNSAQSAFSFKIRSEQLRPGVLIEFVSHFGVKTIAAETIGTAPLKVILEPEVMVRKPVIYLYPEKKRKIVVTHDFKGTLLTTYPAYKDGWTVTARPDGTLYNHEDGKNYAYLFWDGLFTFPPEHYFYKAGFTVKKGEYAGFLQEKLARLGLNDRESNDFIVYWLPEMNRYENCFVHFRVNDDIGGSSVLKTQPAADSRLRLFMEFAGFEDTAAVRKLPEQELPRFDRKGFALVEWGGSEMTLPESLRVYPVRQKAAPLDSELAKALAEGFFELKWGARPASVTGMGEQGQASPGLAVYASELDVTPLLGEVKPTADTMLFFDSDKGFVQAQISFGFRDFQKVDARLHSLLGPSVSYVYEVYKLDKDLVERSEWRVGPKTRVVLEGRFSGASLKISSRDL